MAYSPNSKNIQMAVADEEFTCPLCCDVFNDPKLLPNCAHSYCKSCLRDLVLRHNSTRVSCPVCRKVSKVPRNGVEGFVTNTLLVRLIDNIPGRKDKELVSKALAKCKKEIEKNKTIQEEMEKKFSKINQNREKGLKLKREISKHAQNAIDSIRRWEQNLCSEVDSYLVGLEEKSGLEFHGKFEDLEEQRQKWQNHMEEAAACVKTVDEMLDRNEMGEFLEMKKTVLEQLHEYSDFPSCLSNSKPIQEFKMEFQKHEVKQDLGKVSSKKKTTPLSASSSGLESTAPSHSEPSPSCKSFSSAIKTASGRDYSSRELLEVPLRFQPYRLAVCPRTGDIALVCEDDNKVHLYNSRGRHTKTLSIKHGHLSDVGFTIDNEIVVVNREHNYLMLYKKDGKLINFEYEIPRNCLKYTYVSIDSEGRLIVTSTKATYYTLDSDTVIPCIIVYNNGCPESVKMFGRRALVLPISRAIYQNGLFYIADRCDDEAIIRCFSFQGEHSLNISLPGFSYFYLSISSLPCCGTVFVMRSCTTIEDERYCIFTEENLVTIIQGVEVVQSRKQITSSPVLHAVAIDHDSHGSITQAEMYSDHQEQKTFTIVKYS